MRRVRPGHCPPGFKKRTAQRQFKVLLTNLYVVHSRVMAVADRPLPQESRLRPQWLPIFQSLTCFNDLRRSIRDATTAREDHRIIPTPWTPLPAEPFIPFLGALYFDSSSLRLASSSMRSPVAEHLGGARRYWESNSQVTYPLPPIDDNAYSTENDVFGLDPNCADQRLHMLYFQCARPLQLRSSRSSGTSASGRLFVHVYPLGYVIMSVALAIRFRRPPSVAEAHGFVRKTRPWSAGSNLAWRSRVGQGSLGKIVDVVSAILSRSMFTNVQDALTAGEWFTAIKIPVPDGLADTERLGIPGWEEPVEWLKSHGNYGHSSRDYYQRQEQAEVTCFREVGFSKRSMALFVRPPKRDGDSLLFRRDRSLRLFWRFHQLVEGALMQEGIFGQLREYFDKETATLVSFRLSALEKSKKEDILRLSPYNPVYAVVVRKLDEYMKQPAPFHRRIYSAVATALGVDSLRKEVMLGIGRWEAEIAKWDHPFVMLWRQLLSPIRKAFPSPK